MSRFWQSVSQFDKTKVQYWIAFRNSLAVGLPLAAGVAWGKPGAGVIAAIGALNVSYSDGTDPYFTRARRMLVAGLLVTLAVFIGALTAGMWEFSVLLTAVSAFAAGMMVAVGQSAADIGSITLVTLIVFSAHSMGARDALGSGVLALAGGLLLAAFALALWPVHKRWPERRVLSAFYAELARAASSPAPATEAPPASQESTQAQHELAGLGGNPSLEAERCLALLSQAERIRLALLALARLRSRIGRIDGGEAWGQRLARCLDLASRILASIAQSLLAGKPAGPHTELLDEIRGLADSFRDAASTPRGAELGEFRRQAAWQIDALAGQLRSGEELTAHVSPQGASAFAAREAGEPWRLRLTGAMAVLRANLTLQSAALRHALRMAVCVAAGEGVAHAVDWQRSYWIPMTIVIVLRPDFSGTFSRGVLRLLGTLNGLGVATALLRLLTPSLVVQVALIFLLTFLMRSLGRANYGILVVALSAMIVQMVALTGVAPAQVIAARGVNTFAGGMIALLAYALWPTWERGLLGEALARMLDAYRAYFGAVRDAYLDPQGSYAPALDRTRLASRLERSNLEASIARFRAEPGVSSARLAALDRILANSHRFIHAAMALEAGLSRSQPVPARPAFRPFAADVDRTLQALAAQLRAGDEPRAGLPDLRQDHLQLLRDGDSHVARYELVNIETDRITNSLNTMAEEMAAWGQNA
jgi:uncharacterized membrane protein YccC